jgi:hypothetical protein
MELLQIRFNDFKDYFGFLVMMLLTGCTLGWVINKGKDLYNYWFGKKDLPVKPDCQ